MYLLGELALWVAVPMAAWGAIASFAGGVLHHPPLVSSGARAAAVTLASLTVAAVGLASALLGSEFSFAYVATATSANLPPAYKLTAFWAGAAGSRLLAALLLCACTIAAIAADRARRSGLAPVATGVLLSLALGLLLATALGGSPYARLEWLPPEGRGLPPVLQHPAAALHPPLLALGYAAGAVPFAYAAAAVVARKLDRGWLRAARHWALASWTCLTTGLLVAAWSAYAEIGAQPYVRWGAAPVVALVPWLTTTAHLHGAGSAGRAPPAPWQLALVVATGLFCALAALLSPRVTTGAMQAATGGVLWGATVLVAAAGAATYLLLTRLRNLPVVGDVLETLPGRRYGGHVVHCGIALLAAGAAGLAVRRHHDATLRPGMRLEAVDPLGRRWEFVSQGVSSDQWGNWDATVVAVEARRGGVRVGYLRGERRRHFDSRGAPIGAPLAEVGLLGSFVQDVRSVLVGVGPDESAQFRISFVPLARWLWIGGAVMVVGAAIAALMPASLRGFSR